jgi:prefoldin subunit 5
MPKRIFHATLVTLLVLSITGTGYFGIVNLTRNPCLTTKTWSVGAVDPRFGVSSDTVKLYSEIAASTWNKAYGSNQLLHYVEKNGDIQVTFVYDERQRTTIQNEKLQTSIAEDKSQLDDLKQTLESLKAQYETLGNTIEVKTKSYTAHLSTHNSEVDYWNGQGGAPTEEYQRLQRDLATLETERASLNSSINRYNELATRIKEYGQTHNEVVDTINTKIETLNQASLGEFEEGTYDPATKIITIYEFDNATSLKRVLTHEFGHSLGLKHVDDKEAIMYAVNQGKSLDLAQADKDELARVCRDKTPQDIALMVKTMGDGISHLVLSSLRDIAVQAR